MAEENIFFGASAAGFAAVGQLLADHGVDASASSLVWLLRLLWMLLVCLQLLWVMLVVVFLWVVLRLVRGIVLLVMVVWCRGKG
jgi:hypothetical protein